MIRYVINKYNKYYLLMCTFIFILDVVLVKCIDHLFKIVNDKYILYRCVLNHHLCRALSGIYGPNFDLSVFSHNSVLIERLKLID